MKIQGAVINEQRVTFAIVIVKQSATQSQSSAESARNAFQPLFPGLPLILASQDLRGRFTYQGRKDIVAFLVNVDPSRIPWKEYTVS
ncbi:hypothetical protein [Xanthomonas arboricola]|uniref:hypothetical protein n=1 Tax=Xanthomonas arboricola TaxID=56448 RepID=UPI0018771144|nr:hypothetical protein [Xanthomonas arboricola]